jgi:hypothetical protein
MFVDQDLIAARLSKLAVVIDLVCCEAVVELVTVRVAGRNAIATQDDEAFPLEAFDLAGMVDRLKDDSIAGNVVPTQLCDVDGVVRSDESCFDLRFQGEECSGDQR